MATTDLPPAVRDSAAGRATAATGPVLEAQGLAKSVPGRTLFAGLSLAVAPGEMVAIMGESGVGKSTLLNCLAGLDTLDAGTISLAGQSFAGLEEAGLSALRRQRIGFVFQAFHLLPHLTLGQNVALPLVLAGQAPAAALVAGEAMLAEVGLGGRGSAFPAVLSGGEMQRVAIARALVHRPQLILADEPTGNLDPDIADRVLALLLAEARARGAALVMVTHSSRAARRADRVLRLAADGLHPSTADAHSD